MKIELGGQKGGDLFRQVPTMRWHVGAYTIYQRC